jgi:hypothetical protein
MPTGCTLLEDLPMQCLHQGSHQKDHSSRERSPMFECTTKAPISAPIYQEQQKKISYPSLHLQPSNTARNFSSTFSKILQVKTKPQTGKKAGNSPTFSTKANNEKIHFLRRIHTKVLHPDLFYVTASGQQMCSYHLLLERSTPITRAHLGTDSQNTPRR